MRRTQQLAAVADVMAKAVLLTFLVLVAVDPTWGNLEGKAPVVRAVTYPVWALVVPLIWLGRGRPAPYPWAADLLVTLTAFSDILGNRLDLYDGFVWFDDFMHLLNSGLIAAAFLLLYGRASDGPGVTLAMAIAAGMTVSLAWEAFEYVSFLTRSPEWTTAYQDTMGDLLLGWLGAVLAAAVVVTVRRGGSARDHDGRPHPIGGGREPLPRAYLAGEPRHTTARFRGGKTDDQAPPVVLAGRAHDRPAEQGRQRPRPHGG